MKYVRCDEKFSLRMQELREYVSRSREFFASKFGFCARTIKKWETPTITPQYADLEKLSEYLELYRKYLGIIVSTDWVLYGTGESPKLAANSMISISSSSDLLLVGLPFFFSIDKDMLIQRVNPEYLNLLSDKSLEEIEGKPLIDVLGKERYQIYSPLLQEALIGRVDRYSFKPLDESQPSIIVNCLTGKNNFQEVIGIYNFIEKEHNHDKISKII